MGKLPLMTSKVIESQVVKSQSQGPKRVPVFDLMTCDFMTFDFKTFVRAATK
ncbi:hypothetical protein FTUN_2064 [Frigoriglobus tundricola]|uniref:Uncharacterized protein n=1 Tax=Frigoriglobus tundricola TaxID=2774151 RepID=A0A6M5YML6_9BACT|nr:hypothetical protein FTUN_2064 [Frigoriglobus tundricola]